MLISFGLNILGEGICGPAVLGIRFVSHRVARLAVRGDPDRVNFKHGGIKISGSGPAGIAKAVPVAVLGRREPNTQPQTAGMGGNMLVAGIQQLPVHIEIHASLLVRISGMPVEAVGMPLSIVYRLGKRLKVRLAAVFHFVGIESRSMEGGCVEIGVCRGELNVDLVIHDGELAGLVGVILVLLGILVVFLVLKCPDRGARAKHRRHLRHDLIASRGIVVTGGDGRPGTNAAGEIFVAALHIAGVQIAVSLQL